MSAFGKFGTGGSVPGKYPMPSDDNVGGFTFEAAAIGTEKGNPDSAPEIKPVDGAHK